MVNQSVDYSRKSEDKVQKKATFLKGALWIGSFIFDDSGVNLAGSRNAEERHTQVGRWDSFQNWDFGGILGYRLVVNSYESLSVALWSNAF